MNKTPEISVVIATYNRSDTIRMTLDCLEKQTLGKDLFEAIVVDDGSPDSTEETVKEMMGRLTFQVRYMRHVNSGPGYTQNQGIRAARAPLVCLIADDIHLAPGALKAHLDSHRMHPELNVAVLGRVIQSPALAQSVFLRKWDPFKFSTLEGLKELPYYMFWACNISCKRLFLLKYGLFDEEKGVAGAAAHEDAELGYRLYKNGGLRVFYGKDAFGSHYHVETLEGAMRRAYERGLNWHGFRAKVDSPDITVRYHVLNWHTIKDHLSALKKPDNLFGADKNPFLIIIRHALRLCAFNRATVHLFWLPLMRQAEKNPVLSHFMHKILYRGVISYHFFKGVAEGQKSLASKGRRGV